MDFESISISDLAWQLVPYYGEKAQQKTAADITRPDRFVISSIVPQRSYAIVEKYFYDHLANVDFVELSPLQPLGINSFLANTNGKKSIPTIRGQEVNSDATTALFLEDYKRFVGSDAQDSRLATHVRTVRPKVFAPDTKFLPHFKVFAEVSLGYQKDPFGQKEIDLIVTHLVDEITVLDNIRQNLPNRISELNVYISNLALLKSLFSPKQKGATPALHSVAEAERVWQELNLPKLLPLDSDLIKSLRQLGFQKGLKILRMFMQTFSNMASALSNVNLFFDLSRSAGMEYYRHIVYKISATNENGLELPLADGGSNNWGMKISNNKQIYTVSSGVGTELLIQNYLGPLI